MLARWRNTLFIAPLLCAASCSQSPNQDLLEAIKAQDTKLVEQILSTGNVDFDPPREPESFETPLAYAAAYGNVEITRLLLEAGAHIGGKVLYGDTPLGLALINDNRDVVRYLIDQGADVNAPGDYGTTPFTGVCAQGDFEFVKLCVEHGGNINRSYPDKTSPDQLTWSPLQFAVAKGATDIVKLLVENGGDPTMKDSEGNTCMDIASEQGHQEILELLQASVPNQELNE